MCPNESNKNPSPQIINLNYLSIFIATNIKNKNDNNNYDFRDVFYIFHYLALTDKTNWFLFIKI